MEERSQSVVHHVRDTRLERTLEEETGPIRRDGWWCEDKQEQQTDVEGTGFCLRQQSMKLLVHGFVPSVDRLTNEPLGVL